MKAEKKVNQLILLGYKKGKVDSMNLTTAAILKIGLLVSVEVTAVAVGLVVAALPKALGK